RTLFVIDECHNYLKAKEDSVLVWWFTYHAHLHHELILITQDLSLVNTEYKRVAEYFYRAIPSRFRMSKNTFKYIQYSTAGMYEKDKIGTDTVKADSKIFSLYVSGSDSNGKSIIHKYIFMAVVALSACLISVYSLMGSIAPVDEEIKEETPIQNNTKNETFPQNKTSETPINSNTNTENLAAVDPIEKPNLKLFKFNCFSIMCYYTFEDKTIFEIPQNLLKTYLIDIPPDKKYLELKNNKLMIYVLTAPNKFNFIKERGNENEKNQNENSGIIPSITN
ncbi:zonular occludens toxin domain-containing protein, partial [bacterium]|nr:zonular occludens toxin domain-containing protein [bacterium]